MKKIKNDSLPLVVAAGYFCDTPSNYMHASAGGAASTAGAAGMAGAEVAGVAAGVEDVARAVDVGVKKMCFNNVMTTWVNSTPWNILTQLRGTAKKSLQKAPVYG